MLRNTLLYLRFPLVTYVTVRSRQEIRVRRILLVFDMRRLTCVIKNARFPALTCIYPF